MPVQADRPGVRPDQAHDHVEGGGLAGAVGAEQSHRLATADVDRHVPHHRALLVGLADPVRHEPATAVDHAQRFCQGALAPVLPGWDESFGTTRPSTRRPGVAGERRDAGPQVDHRLVTVELVLPAREVNVAGQPRDAGIRNVDALVGADDLGRGPDLDMAERVHPLQLATGIGQRVGARLGGGGRSGGDRVHRVGGGGRVHGVADQHVRGEAAAVLGVDDGVAAADRHVLLRPVLHDVPGGHGLVRRDDVQVPPGHHQHGLVDVVHGMVAKGLVVRRGVDVDVAFRLQPVDLAVAGVVGRRGRPGRGRQGSPAAAAAMRRGRAPSCGSARRAGRR